MTDECESLESADRVSSGPAGWRVSCSAACSRLHPATQKTPRREARHKPDSREADSSFDGEMATQFSPLDPPGL